MKESRLYFNFLKQYFIYFLISGVLFSTWGFLYQLQKPTQYKVSQLLEISHTDSDTFQKIAQVQEAVTLARSANVQQSLQTDSQIAVFNNSPLTIAVESTSPDLRRSSLNLGKVTAFLGGKFLFISVGDLTTTVIQPNLLLGTLAGFGVGIFLTLVAILFYRYIKNF